MTNSISDTGTLASGVAATDGGTVLLIEAPGTSGGTSAASGFDARERIHRVAGMVHQAIDKLERSLSSTRDSAMGAQGKYGEQARQYGETLRGRVDAQPLQSVGIAFGAGVLLSKLLLRPAKVRVVKVPVPVRTPSWQASPAPERFTQRWIGRADARVQGLRGTGYEAAGAVGAAAKLGAARTKAAAATLALKASALPLQMRLASERLRLKSHVVGGSVRPAVQAHPVAAAGTVLGVAAVATTLWLQRRQPAPGTPYVTVDDKGNGVAWQRAGAGFPARTRELVASRPVASAAVVMVLGAVVGTLLSRR